MNIVMGKKEIKMGQRGGKKTPDGKQEEF